MKHIKLFEEFVDSREDIYKNFRYNKNLQYRLLNLDKKKFNDVYSKHKWYVLSKNDKENFKNNLFTLVNISYDQQGGHVRINSPNKVTDDAELTFWTAADVDHDPYADVVIFGKKTKYGTKISGVGTDDQVESKDILVKKMSSLLHQKGFYAEVSGGLTKLLLKSKTPYVNDVKLIRRIFNDSSVRFVDQYKNYYTRKLENGEETQEEILFGIPFNKFQHIHDSPTKKIPAFLD